MHPIRNPAADRRDSHDLRGPGGCTEAWGLEPDIFVIGKGIGGGLPSGAYGITGLLPMQCATTRRLTWWMSGSGRDSGRQRAVDCCDASDARRGPDGHELRAHDRLATRFREVWKGVLEKYDVPWSVEQLGARAEYRFCSPAPRTGSESAAAHDDEIEEYLHLYLSNRGC